MAIAAPFSSIARAALPWLLPPPSRRPNRRYRRFRGAFEEICIVTIRTAICFAVAVTAAGLATPASAQFLVPPHEIVTSVRSMGLQPVTQPVLRRGGRYVLHAIDRTGMRMKVAADGRNGRILFVEPLGPARGPVYVERDYPPVRAVPPRGGSAHIPADPPVIYAPGSTASAPPPPARPPVAAKPAAPPKVAAKSAAKPHAASAAPAETAEASGQDIDSMVSTRKLSAGSPGASAAARARTRAIASGSWSLARTW